MAAHADLDPGPGWRPGTDPQPAISRQRTMNPQRAKVPLAR